MILSKGKKITFIFTAIFLSLLISLVIAEVILRFILPIAEPSYSITEQDPLLKPDEKIIYTFRPNSELGVDKNGFKNKDVLDNYDIVCLGDSHTNGGVKQWPIYLSEKIQKTVYNMGVDGYGFAQYYYLTDKALSFKPRFLIVGFYTGNDLYDTYDVVYRMKGWDNYKNPDFIDNNPQSISDTKQVKIFLRPLRDFLRNKLKLYAFIGDRTRIWREKIGLATPRYTGVKDWKTENSDISLLYDEKTYLKTLFWAGHRFYGVNLEDEKVREGLRLSREFLLEMKKKADQVNTELIIAMIPSKLLAYEKIVGEKANENIFYKKVLENEKKIRQDNIAFCEENNIRWADTLNLLQEDLEKNIKLYPETMNEHPLDVGYEVYAEAIAKYINDNNLFATNTQSNLNVQENN